MTQKDTEPRSHPIEGSELKRSTRIENAPPDLFDPDAPRLGRRESELHSSEITYLHDVLTTNFSDGKTMWDLHHYFMGSKGVLKDEKVDIVFDISFFKDLQIPHSLSSYDARNYGGKLPDIALNVLSKSTWRADLSEYVDTCKNLGIPVYAVFSPYKVTSKVYEPPFLRVFILEEDGSYDQLDLHEVTLKEGKEINEENIINLEKKLPFRLGLMQMKQLHQGNQPRFRLILIDPSEPKIFPTRAEKAEARAEKAEGTLQAYRRKYGDLDWINLKLSIETQNSISSFLV